MLERPTPEEWRLIVTPLGELRIPGGDSVLSGSELYGIKEKDEGVDTLGSLIAALRAGRRDGYLNESEERLLKRLYAYYPEIVPRIG